MGRRPPDEDRVVLGAVTATVMRGKGERGPRRYWRIRHRETRAHLEAGWWTRAEVEDRVAVLARDPRSRSERDARPVDVGPTMGEVLARWAVVVDERHAAGEIAARTRQQYRLTAGHWAADLGDVSAAELSRELVDDTLRRWRASGVAPRSAKLAADVLATCLRWSTPRRLTPAVDLRRLSSAVVDQEERVNCEHTPDRGEAEAALGRIASPRDRAVVELLAWTGARVGEVAALTVGSWDRARAELVISGRDRRRARRGKVRARRWPTTGRLRELLDELTAGRPPEAPLVEDLPRDVAVAVRVVLLRACADAGVERFTAHGLRRMVALELLDATDPRTVAELTGHSVAILLRDYVRPSADRLRDVVSRAHGHPARLRVVAEGDEE